MVRSNARTRNLTRAYCSGRRQKNPLEPVNVEDSAEAAGDEPFFECLVTSLRQKSQLIAKASGRKKTRAADELLALKILSRHGLV